RVSVHRHETIAPRLSAKPINGVLAVFQLPIAVSTKWFVFSFGLESTAYVLNDYCHARSSILVDGNEVRPAVIGGADEQRGKGSLPFRKDDRRGEGGPVPHLDHQVFVCKLVVKCGFVVIYWLFSEQDGLDKCLAGESRLGERCSAV